MRLFGFLLILAGSTAAMPAQTNAPADLNTNGPVEAPTNASVAGAYGAPELAPTNVPLDIRRLSLQDCIQLALRHNLEIQINRYNPSLALYALRGTYGGYDPTFGLSGEHDRNEAGSRLLGGGFSIPGSVSDANAWNSSLGGLLPWGMSYSLQGGATDTYGHSSSFTTNGVVTIPFESTTGSASVNVTQPLLKNFWMDSTRLNIQVARNRLKYSEQALKQQIMQTITTLEQAYFDLIYSRENTIVQKKAVELAERLVVENRKKLEVGTLAPLDLQSAEAQAASTRAAVIAAQSQLGTQERLVKALITDDYPKWASAVLEPTETLTTQRPMLNLQDSWSKALAQRPDLLQAKLDVARAGIQLKYSHNQLFPQLDLFGTYGFNGSGVEFSDALYDIQQTDRPFYTYGARLSVPLARTTARNNYRADKATLQQVVLTLKRLEESIMINIDNDIGTIRANFDQVQATRAAREYEESALDAEQKKLENGKSTTYTVLQVQRDLTTARGSEIQALDTYNKSLSQLSLDEGTTLERLGIDFEVK